MRDVIVIAGAPGSGKSSVAELLSEKLGSPNIDFGDLRNFHLDPEWKNKNDEEEKIAFENLLFIIRNYLGHDYHDIIVHDLPDFRVPQMAKEFPNSITFTLAPSSTELEKRIGARKSGFKDVAKAIEWNENIRKRPPLPNEHRMDNTLRTPRETLEEVLKILS